MIVRTLPEVDPFLRSPRGRKIDEQVDALLKGAPASHGR